MKYVKAFDNFSLNENHETEEGRQFSRIIPKRKIDKDFEIKAESIANLIINCPEFSELKELALRYPFSESEGESKKECLSELGRCFPTLDLRSIQIVNYGTKIPFYGRLKHSAGYSDDIYLPAYIAKKVQEPGYKY